MTKENISDLVKKCLDNIKDELLLFSVLTILLITSFPEVRMPIFVVYLIAVISYSMITVVKLSSHKSNNRFLENFEKYLGDKNEWEKESGRSEVYFYKSDNNYKIEQATDVHQTWTARESWMENFPDPTISEWKIYLKHGENKIAEFSFLSCDGHRYFVPVPRKRCVDEGQNFRCRKFEYYWVRDSIEYKLGEIIGSFYRGDGMEYVAKFCGINVH